MELYHIVSFVLTYFVLIKSDYEKLDDDPLFNVIPSMKIPTGFLYALSFIPMILLISKSEKFVYTEHLSVGLSYYLFSKSMMYALGNRKQEPLYHVGIGVLSVLMLIYAQIIPKEMMILGYGMIAGLTYVTVGSRKTSSDLIFLDILLAHLMFYFSKRAVVTA
jgi:hypothetical protein